MEPLDLSAYPPRPTRNTISGVMFLPRTIDKLRAELPGGSLNNYLTDYDRGLTSYVLYKLGIPIDELRAVVRDAATESDVVAWLEARVDRSKSASINAKLTEMRVDAMQPADRDLMYSRHPNVAVGEHTYVLDVIDAEDAAMTSQ